MPKRSGKRSGKRRSKTSRKQNKTRSPCNRKKSSPCKRSPNCNWVKSKSSGKRRHKGYCRGSTTGRPKKVAFEGLTGISPTIMPRTSSYGIVPPNSMYSSYSLPPPPNLSNSLPIPPNLSNSLPIPPNLSNVSSQVKLPIPPINVPRSNIMNLNPLKGMSLPDSKLLTPKKLVPGLGTVEGQLAVGLKEFNDIPLNLQGIVKSFDKMARKEQNQNSLLLPS